MYVLDMAPARALPTAKTYESFADCRRQNQTGKIGKKGENIREISALNYLKSFRIEVSAQMGYFSK